MINLDYYCYYYYRTPGGQHYFNFFFLQKAAIDGGAFNDFGKRREHDDEVATSNVKYELLSRKLWAVFHHLCSPKTNTWVHAMDSTDSIFGSIPDSITQTLFKKKHKTAIMMTELSNSYPYSMSFPIWMWKKIDWVESWIQLKRVPCSDTDHQATR